jgi:hypothetical protein
VPAPAPASADRRPNQRGGRGRGNAAAGKPAARPARELHPVLVQLAQEDTAAAPEFTT